MTAIYLTLLAGLTLFYLNDASRKVNPMDNFSCKAKLEVYRESRNFIGVIDINVVQGNGILRGDGVIRNASGTNYIVQRSILFKAENYRSAPAWRSYKIVTTHLDNAPDNIMLYLFPSFYIQPSLVTNINLKSLPDKTMLIIKSHLPYLYCSGL